MRSLCLATLVVSVSIAGWAADSKSQSGFPVDRSVDPCVDFYQFACNAWNASHPIPGDQSRWGTFDELVERNRQTLRGILEKAEAGGPQRGTVDREIGDYYAACIDQAAADAAGVDPIKPELERIAALASENELTDEFVHLHTLGVPAVFDFGSQVDRRDSAHRIASVRSAGLSLPDRDYYLKTDARSVKLREQFVAHAEAMFRLLDESPEAAAAKAKTVLSIETEFAKATLDRVARRDPEKTYHKLTVHELVSLDPGIDWPRYFQSFHAPAFETLNVTYPPYFRQMESLLVQQSLDDWKTYLAWQVTNAFAPLLSKPFVAEEFRFSGGVLNGLREQPARWKRCVTLVDGQLG
ncbi:MAG: M13 family peptidase, partial [Bryobacteraceae bacterium]